MMSPLTLSAQPNDESRPPRPPEANSEARPERPQDRQADKANREANQNRRKMRRVEELRRAGKHEEAEQLAQRIRKHAGGPPRADATARPGKPQQERMAGPDGKPGLKKEGPEPRIEHLQIASRHLQAAGYKNLAASAQAEIQKIIKAKENQTKGDPALREEVRQLRREVDELRKQLRRLNS